MICSEPRCTKERRKWRTLCTTHAGRKSRKQEPLRSTWVQMKQRCHNPKSQSYHRYGARGIKVCPEWMNNFELFKKDMGEKPSSSHSIDRIDNEGDYTPDNCRWATQLEQHYNRRPSRKSTSGVSGVCLSPKSAVLPWRAYVFLSGKQIHLGYYETKEEAIESRKAGEDKYYQTNKEEPNASNSLSTLIPST